MDGMGSEGMGSGSMWVAVATPYHSSADSGVGRLEEGIRWAGLIVSVGTLPDTGGCEAGVGGTVLPLDAGDGLGE